MAIVCRVATNLGNVEKSWNYKMVREKSVNLEVIREKPVKICSCLRYATATSALDTRETESLRLWLTMPSNSLLMSMHKPRMYTSKFELFI